MVENCLGFARVMDLYLKSWYGSMLQKFLLLLVSFPPLVVAGRIDLFSYMKTSSCLPIFCVERR